MKSIHKIVFAILMIILLFLFTSGCATHSLAEITDPPGFWYGLLHGFLILFSFIGSFFTDYEIYAIPNSGTWYDLGYLLGAMIFFGGGGAKAKR